MRFLFSLLTASGLLAFSSPSEYQPPEPVPSGCQDLDALPHRPIHLTGRIFATYLPDGRRYTKLREPSPPDYFELGVLDLNKPGTPIQRLTSDLVHDAEVRVAPDGQSLVWSVRPALDFFDGSNTIMSAKVTADGLADIRVLAHGENQYLGIPSFVKPGGGKVLFSRQGEGDEVTKLLEHDLTTGASRVLPTTFKGTINDPQMSRDGKWIVFKSGDAKDEDIVRLYIMNANGKGARKLTKGQTRDEDPAFSPDGRTVAFERMYGMADHKGQQAEDYFFQEGVVSVDVRTGKETQLTVPDPCGKNELWLPTWSPDGELLMFTRGLHLENGEFTHDLWVMRKDGTDLQRVPNSDGIMFFDWVM